MFKKIKLPRIEKFKSKDSIESPYLKFYIWAVNQIDYFKLLYGDEGSGDISEDNLVKIFKNLNVGDFYLNIVDSRKLDNITYEWISKYRYESKKTAQNALSMLKFQFGPNEFINKEEIDKYPFGYVYIRISNE